MLIFTAGTLGATAGRHLAALAARQRRKSGDDPTSPTKRNVGFLDAFRPRSKSDATRMKKPTLMATMKQAMHVGPLLDIPLFLAFPAILKCYFVILSHSASYACK